MFIDEDPRQFESRKADHIRIAIDPRSQTEGASGLDKLHLRHEAFPEINFSDIDTRVDLFHGRKPSLPPTSPMFVSSMTAGHEGSIHLNLVMARVCEKRQWLMGVGSQRKQLTDFSADSEWTLIRKQCPRVRLLGNIGLSQLIVTPTDQVRRLIDSLQAEAMIVHTNPLQEVLQPEGTPQFAGGLQAVERLCRELEVPVIVKETGCGFSLKTLTRLKGLGLAAVDVSGLGGTHWGRVEGHRSKPGDRLFETARTFQSWGVSLLDSLLAARAAKPDFEIWGSGGVRTGLDAAKCLALGARMVGIAKPVIEAALAGENALDERLALFEYELKTALFCTGSRTVAELRENQQWDL